MSEEERRINAKMLLESIQQLAADVREFSKYLITLAVTIIPIMIGVAGFLLGTNELNGFAVGFLITGLAFIFITIPINLSLYLPTYNAYSPETFDLLNRLAQNKKEKSKYSIILLVIGMLSAFIGILLIIAL